MLFRVPDDWQSPKNPVIPMNLSIIIKSSVIWHVGHAAKLKILRYNFDMTEIEFRGSDCGIPRVKSNRSTAETSPSNKITE
jgi:hypothetical protein